MKQVEGREAVPSNLWLRIEDFLVSTCLKTFMFLGVKAGNSSERTVREFVRFSIVGFSNTAISYVLYSLFLVFLRLYVPRFTHDYLVASVASFLLSVLWAYFWSAKVVFRGKRDLRQTVRALFRCYVSYGFSGLIIANVLLYMLINGLRISAYKAFFCVLLITVPLNFVMNKFWAFKLMH